MFWMWVIIFATWHNMSSKALLSISCFFSKWCPWCFNYPLGFFFVFGYAGLGFGFGPLQCLSFKYSLAPFVFMYPFCFVTKGDVSFLFPLNCFIRDPFDVTAWNLFFLFPQWVSHFPLMVDQLVIKRPGCAFDNSFQEIRKNFK